MTSPSRIAPSMHFPAQNRSRRDANYVDRSRADPLSALRRLGEVLQETASLNKISPRPSHSRRGATTSSAMEKEPPRSRKPSETYLEAVERIRQPVTARPPLKPSP